MKNKTGYLLTVFGAICWAFSGACGQYLFQHRGLDADWLVSVRLTMAGLLLVLYSLGRMRGGAVRLFRSRRSVGSILVFAVFGMAMCQYSYFRSIELSNAATATTLQYTGPAIVLLWLALREKRMPTRKELIAVACAMGGAFLLATHGDPSQLALSPKALFWCVLAAASIAVYSVQPRGLIAQYGTMPVTGFGMLIGGLGLCVIFQPWHVVGQWDWVTVMGMLYIIVFGTICAFCCYLEGVRRIGAAKGSILASVEPVASAVLSVVWLGVPLGGMDFGGIALIVAAMVLLGGDSDQTEDKNLRKIAENSAKA
ncbi:DMT family transporter [Agathobaculum sp. Marseille-P7918]|uniref:DMT family transporter n=1 Tax=Agathobaculum sp. Marseille-P7918 TaxID=2479843 RepID=UPI000F641558|nr:DMT family transporter [Agathobaculum sp. Marseille-P7918]